MLPYPVAFLPLQKTAHTRTQTQQPYSRVEVALSPQTLSAYPPSTHDFVIHHHHLDEILLNVLTDSLLHLV